jgi:hypothetical protein
VDKKTVILWSAVAVAIICCSAGVIWNITKGSKKVVVAPTPVFAPQGQLVPQFPTNLILDSNAAISGSYAINYSSITNQYTAEYDSSSTMPTLYNDYQSYLPKNGWNVTGSLTTHPTFDAIAASQGHNQLQVVISPYNKESQVTITYATE